MKTLQTETKEISSPRFSVCEREGERAAAGAARRVHAASLPQSYQRRRADSVENGMAVVPSSTYAARLVSTDGLVVVVLVKIAMEKCCFFGLNLWH